MKYMGSKRKIAKEILPIILKNRNPNQWYVEPFCGGCNSLDKVSGNRIASDNNKYLIALLKKMQEGNIEFPFIGEKEYQEIKNNKDNYPDWILGYVGFQLSFGAKWFGGYRRDKVGIRDYQNEAQQNLKAQQNLIKDVTFYNCNYWELEVPNNSIIYCDPPYEGTTKYKDNFDHSKFWNWCNDMVSEGHEVFASEYHAPVGWKSIWNKTVTTTLDVNNYKEDFENLFVKEQ
jgi:DNA adenine methylase